MTPAFSLYGGPFLLRKYYTSGTQVVHKWYTGHTQVLHKHYIFRSMTPDIPQKKATVLCITVALHYSQLNDFDTVVPKEYQPLGLIFFGFHLYSNLFQDFLSVGNQILLRG